MTNHRKDPVLTSADDNKNVGTLTPIRNNSSSTTFNGIVPTTPPSRVSITAYGKCSTGRRCSSDAGGAPFVECASTKRRRLSEEENMAEVLPSVVLLPSFESVSSYRDPTAGGGYDSDEEDNVEQNHEKGMRELLMNLYNANKNSIKMEGNYNLVLLHIPRAKWYVMNDGTWISNGIASVKFLKRVEAGEYGHGMISISIAAENLEEATTLEIDKPVSSA